ncbi:THAP domain-containing protein 5-like [Orussus abietinus]|uniref:THAP domain-containing protein 5-like n=1 Tax=Orussus abietinus TaxID=222816 RepID=UPI000625A70F|nr:THAP domain-containing protein 5-like [Orussus abietinus]
MFAMQSCCIKGCESYKNIASKNIGYFKFPLHDEILLNKWLKQIGQTDWHPTDQEQICGAHFQKKDIDSHPNRKYPCLKPSAVPTIFPVHPVVIEQGYKNRKPVDINGQSVEMKILNSVNVNPKLTGTLPVLPSSPLILIPTLMNQPPNVNQPLNVGQSLIHLTPVTQSRLRKILPKPDHNSLPKTENIVILPKKDFGEPITSTPKVHTIVNKNPSKMIVQSIPGNKKPILKITINKMYRNGTRPKEIETQSQTLSSIGSNKSNPSEIVSKAAMEVNVIESERSIPVKNVQSMYQPPVKPTVSIPPSENSPVTMAVNKIEKHKQGNETMTEVPDRTKGASQDHAYSASSTLKLRHLYSKAQEDCTQLRIRLQMLRQKHKEEQEEIRKLQNHLIQLGKRVQTTPDEPNILNNTKPQRKKRVSLLDDTEREEEFEKLLREVRKIKQEFKRNKQANSKPNTKIIKSGIRPEIKEENDIKLTNRQKDQTVLNIDENELSKLSDVDEGEIIGEIDDDCDDIIDDLDDDSMDLEFNDEEEDMDYQDEYLDSDLIDE